MVGKIFITRSGYDPQVGKYLKDPYLDGIPSMGACRPDIRKSLGRGDTIFVVSGKIPGFEQFIIGCFDIREKITMQEAFRRFPEQRLHKRDDGQLAGNIIMDADANQHELDDHKNFATRISDYVIGENAIVLSGNDEIQVGRRQTMNILQDVFSQAGTSKPFDILGRSARNLNRNQVGKLKSWLNNIKQNRA